MGNENIDEIILGPIELYNDGERANAEVLNRPIIELRDNQLLHGNILSQIYGVLGADNLNLDTFLEIGSKITVLEASVSDLEANSSGNSSGETTNFLGSLSIAENLTVNGTIGSNDGSVNFADDIIIDGNISAVNGYLSGDLYVTGSVFSAGDELATKNWVLSNAGGGAGGDTEITKIFRYTGNSSTSEYNADFLSNSIVVFVDGILSSPEKYTLWYDDGNGLVQNGTNGVKVEFNENISNNSSVSIVCYGGANVYSKAEVDDKLSNALRIDKTIELENILSIRYTGGQNTDLVDLITYSNNYTEIYTYDTSDRIIYIDYALSGTVQGSSEKTYDTQGRLSTVTFVNGDTTGSR